LFCLGYSSQPSTKYIFTTAHYFNSFYVPIAQQAGQAAVLGRLSLHLALASVADKLTYKYRQQQRNL
jgi:hypothetical protein